MAKEELTTDELLNLFVKNGYTFSLQAQDDATYVFWICRKEWITSDIAQARELPQGLGNTPRGAILNLIETWQHKI